MMVQCATCSNVSVWTQVWYWYWLQLHRAIAVTSCTRETATLCPALKVDRQRLAVGGDVK